MKKGVYQSQLMEQSRFAASHRVCAFSCDHVLRVYSCMQYMRWGVHCALAGACGCQLKEVSLAYLLKGSSRKSRPRMKKIQGRTGRASLTLNSRVAEIRIFRCACIAPVVKPELHARVRLPPRIEQGDRGRTAECQCSQCCQCRYRFVLCFRVSLQISIENLFETVTKPKFSPRCARQILP